MANATHEAGVLVIGDGFFANLRPLTHYSERVCFVASITFNSILAVLLMREENQTLKPYSRVLLTNVAADLFYTIMCMVVGMDLELNSGVYIWAINGFIKDCSPGVQKLAMSLWITSCCAACLVTTIEFIFRYFLVVRRHTLTYMQLLLCVGVILACGSFDAMWFYMAMNSVEDHAAEFGHLMTHPMWHEGGSVLYYGADIGNVYFLLFLFSVTTQDMAMFVVIALSTLATIATLRKTAHQMSAKARYMQAQVNRLMFAEIFSLVSVAVVPIACMMPLLFFKVKYAGLGLLITLFLQYIPSVNP
ncbi:hypothetical protein AAVH_30345, partial [Aphelenchoides avenae]